MSRLEKMTIIFTAKSWKVVSNFLANKCYENNALSEIPRNFWLVFLILPVSIQNKDQKITDDKSI